MEKIIFEELLALAKHHDNPEKQFELLAKQPDYSVNDYLNCAYHLDKKIKEYKKNNKEYYYLMTFTLRHNILCENEVETYIIKRLKRKALKIVKAHIVKEYTKNNIAHWHVAVKSKKYISKDRFKYYTKLYGNIDISKNHSQNYDYIIEYISKSNIPKEIIREGELEDLTSSPIPITHNK